MSAPAPETQNGSEAQAWKTSFATVLGSSLEQREQAMNDLTYIPSPPFGIIRSRQIIPKMTHHPTMWGRWESERL